MDIHVGLVFSVCGVLLLWVDGLAICLPSKYKDWDVRYLVWIKIWRGATSLFSLHSSAGTYTD